MCSESPKSRRRCVKWNVQTGKDISKRAKTQNCGYFAVLNREILLNRNLKRVNLDFFFAANLKLASKSTYTRFSGLGFRFSVNMCISCRRTFQLLLVLPLRRRRRSPRPRIVLPPRTSPSSHHGPLWPAPTALSVVPPSPVVDDKVEAPMVAAHVVKSKW
jgi:hypothetical protein